MDGHKKISLIISVLMLVFTFLIVIVISINFKKTSHQRELEKAVAIAALVRDGLTTHMINGIMNERKLFLDEVKSSSKADKLWIFRAEKVVKDFGEGLYQEHTRDEIDKEVVKKGKIISKFNDDIFDPKLRVTIPYIAKNDGRIDCLKCHKSAKDGDVLGGISMVFSLSSTEKRDIMAIKNIVIISLLFAIILIFIANFLIKPYVDTLYFLKESLRKASYGDYSSRIRNPSNKESKEVAKWLNTLLEKLDSTVSSIEKNIALFISDRRRKYDSPLDKSRDIIEELADIYRFKKTIEQDISKDVIYDRLVQVFKEKLKIKDLSLYEVDLHNDTRKLIYDDTLEKLCEAADTKTSLRCRAFRTNSIVSSDEFSNLCRVCKTNKEYLCMSFVIDDNIAIILNIKPETKEELYENKKAIGYIRNYLEAAKPILQSKLLTEILKESNLKDGLTKLYNRKYLDIFMDKEAKLFKSFAVVMLDIDYFKKVNDTYGHDAGDYILRGLATIMMQNVNADDVVFRFGGEEFLIFIPDINRALETTNKIKDSFENKTFYINSKEIKKTLSAGVAFYPQDSQSIWGAIKCADIALYKAKENGRNRVEIYSNINKKG